jgi:hypothetical protein
MEVSARRAQRESLRQQIAYNKMVNLENAAQEVEMNENQIAVLQSMHQDCTESVDWNKIKNLEPPSVPIKNNEYKRQAQNNLENYKPTLFQKLFGKVEKINESLKEEIKSAIKKDEEKYMADLKTYEEQKKEWEEDISIATKVLDGDLVGYERVLDKLNPFSEISELGTSLSISFPNKDFMVVDLNVHSEVIIPSEVKSLLKSGKVSIKPMAIIRYNEIYQDHVCSSILRIAREAFAVLPVKKVLVTAYSNLLNTTTGHKEETPVISVLIPSETLHNLNFDTIDPSNSMKNFVHNMNFKKTQGFTGVEKINFEKYL